MPVLERQMLRSYLEKGGERVYTKLKNTITSTTDYNEAYANYTMLLSVLSEQHKVAEEKGDDVYLNACTGGLLLGSAAALSGGCTPPALGACGAASVTGTCIGFFGKFIKQSYILSSQEYRNVKDLLRAASAVVDIYAPKQVESRGLRKRH